MAGHLLTFSGSWISETFRRHPQIAIRTRTQPSWARRLKKFPKQVKQRSAAPLRLCMTELRGSARPNGFTCGSHALDEIPPSPFWIHVYHLANVGDRPQSHHRSPSSKSDITQRPKPTWMLSFSTAFIREQHPWQDSPPHNPLSRR